MYKITKKQEQFLKKILLIGLEQIITDKRMYRIYKNKSIDTLKEQEDYYYQSYRELESIIYDILKAGEYGDANRQFLNTTALYYNQRKNVITY